MLGLIVLGFLYSSRHFGISELLLACLIGSLYLAHGYSLNDIHDKQLKVSSSHQRAIYLSLTSLILCLAGSALISLEFFCVVIFGHLCGMFYSAHPFRFKNKLWLDLVFNSLSLAPLFLLGYLTNDKLSPESTAVTLLFFLYFIPIQLLHQMNDNITDRNFNEKNTFQILGLKKTKIVLHIALISFAIINLFLWQLSVLSLFSSLSGVLFAFLLIAYIHFRFSATYPTGQNAFYRVKLDARYLSILYGILLGLSFYELKP